MPSLGPSAQDETSVFSCLWRRTHTIGALASQAFCSDGNYTPSFPGSLACRWQIMRLLSLQNHTSLIINLSLHHSFSCSLSLFLSTVIETDVQNEMYYKVYIYLSIPPFGSASLEHPDQYRRDVEILYLGFYSRCGHCMSITILTSLIHSRKLRCAPAYCDPNVIELKNYKRPNES